MKKFFLLLALLVWPLAAFGATDLQEGDLVFQSQEGNFSKAIQRATHSPYNHMGMVFIRHGKPYVLEAVGPVKFTSLDRWIHHGMGGHFVAKRLKDPSVLTPKVLKDMETRAQKYLGKRYSFTFAWSEENFYCSGLVWRIYHDVTGLEVGKFQKLGDMDLKDPLVQKELKQHFGPFIPMDHELISPAAMFGSGLLHTVRQE